MYETIIKKICVEYPWISKKKIDKAKNEHLYSMLNTQRETFSKYINKYVEAIKVSEKTICVWDDEPELKMFMHGDGYIFESVMFEDTKDETKIALNKEGEKRIERIINNTWVDAVKTLDYAKFSNTGRLVYMCAFIIIKICDYYKIENVNFDDIVKKKIEPAVEIDFALLDVCKDETIEQTRKNVMQLYKKIDSIYNYRNQRKKDNI